MQAAPARNRALLLLCVIAFALAFYKAKQFPPATAFQPPLAAESPASVPHFEAHFASSRLFTQVHAASLVGLQDGRIRSFWFSGSHEGADDVAIHSALFDPQTSRWSAEQTVATREQTQQALHRYIAYLGNPVVGRAADGSLRMFYVTVSIGGWAGSSLVTMVSHDEGQSWSAPQRLVTSPFLNISTLVKGVPFRYADGSMGVPVYHEFIAKFGELMRLDSDGKVVDLQRLVSGVHLKTLQPVIFIKDAHTAQVLMRYGNFAKPRRVMMVSTQDAGRHWTPAQKTTLQNPDAAVAGVALPDGRMLAVLNNIDDGRDALSLMISADDGNNWREVSRLEDQIGERGHSDGARLDAKVRSLLRQSDAGLPQQLEPYIASTHEVACRSGICGYEFSYPYLIRTDSGDFHLVYTWNRTFIKHLWFNQAWLEQRLKEIPHDELH